MAANSEARCHAECLAALALPGAQSWSRQMLEDTLAHHNRCVINIKMQLNTLSPISTLPPEILSKVFLHTGSWLPQSIRISQVCKQWRAVALECPPLWSRWTMMGPREWLSELLARSKRAPLSVTIWRDTCELDDLLSLCLSSLNRIQALTINVSIHDWILKPEEMYQKTALRLLDAPAPLLDSLSIIGISEHSAWLSPAVTLLLKHSERLQYLELSNCAVLWDGVFLENLTHFVIHHAYSHDPSETEFLNVVSRMSSLEALEVYGVFTHAEYGTREFSEPSPIQAQLLRLRQLRLREGSLSTACLLESLHTPSLTYLSVTLDRVDRTAPESHIDLFNAIAEKMPYLGDILSLTMSTRHGRTSISAYDCAGDELEMHTPILKLRGDRLDHHNVITAFCNLLPVTNVVRLSLEGFTPTGNLWVNLTNRITMITDLHLSNNVRRPPASLLCAFRAGRGLYTMQHEHIARGRYPLPRLRCLVVGLLIGSSADLRGVSDQRALEESLLRCLIDRREHGMAIDTLHILQAVYTSKRYIGLLKEIVPNVVWAGTIEGEIQEPVNGE